MSFTLPGQPEQAPQPEQQAPQPEAGQSGDEKLAALVAARESLKANLLAAQQELDANTVEIADIIHSGDTGQKSRKVGEGRVTVKRGYNYKVNAKSVQAVCQALSTEECVLFAPVATKTSYVLDEKGYRWYEANNRAVFTAISKHVTSTPKKVAVEVK